MIVTDLTDLTLADARDGLRAKRFSASELARAHLDAIETGARAQRLCSARRPSARSRMAKASDDVSRAARGGALEGIPLGIKDLFCTEGVRTTAGSHILDGFVPPYESTVTSQLWRDGAVMLGKLNNDEFAMGSSNETSHYGPVVSPWRRQGSNVHAGRGRGSRARISCRAARPAARRRRWRRGCASAPPRPTPAAPSASRRPSPAPSASSRPTGAARAGASSPSRPPSTRPGRSRGRCATAPSCSRSMAGHDPKDTTSADLPVPDFEAAVSRGVKGLKIGIPEGIPARRHAGRRSRALWADGAAWLRDAGAEIVDVSLPHTKYALPAYYIVAPAEASSNLARYDGVRYGLRVPGRDVTDLYENTRADGFGREVKRRVMIGTYVLSAGYYDAYYVRAQKIRTLIKRDFEEVYAGGVDAILTPATPSAAFAIGEKGSDDPVEMYLNDVFTVTVNMAGLPGIAVPAGLDGQGLPLGLQLIGRPFDEETLFAVGQAIEDAAGRLSLPEPWWATA